MKKGLALAAVLLCVSMLFACVEAQNAQLAFSGSPGGQMIGRTFQEVEAAYGPFSMVYYGADRTPAFIFAGSNVSFQFAEEANQSQWRALLTDGTGYVPGAVALLSIQPGWVCTGVSGRIRDFGIAESDVTALSQYLAAIRPQSRTTGTYKIYTVTTVDGALQASVFCPLGSDSFGMDDWIEVTSASAVTSSTPVPTADPQVTEFALGGEMIPVGATKVEVRGTSSAHRTVTPEEFADLVTYCPHLKSLILDYCNISGEEQIAALKELTTLELMTCGLPDVSFVKGLTRITRLGLCHNALADVSAIEHLPLTYLNIADNPDLGNSGVRSAGKITSLEQLYIYSLNITDLSPLKSLKHLDTLNVNNDSKINQHDLSELSGLTKLRKLQINGTGVTSLFFLFDDFPDLRELEARKLHKLKNPTESFFALVDHPNLTKVTLVSSIQKTMDAYAQDVYGMSAADWFGDYGITLMFK